MTVHNILAGTAADEDIPIPAPTGTHWGPRRVDPPPADAPPAPALAQPVSDSRPWPVERALRREYRRGFWWGLLCGAVWTVALAFLMGIALQEREQRAERPQPVAQGVRA